MRNSRKLLHGLLAGLLSLGLAACGGSGDDKKSDSKTPDDATPQLTIGLIAKSQNNPVFRAARVGAMDAARDLSEKYGIRVEVRWQTPNNEDAQQQAQFVESLTNAGVDGIAISCIDANLLNATLKDAVDKGITVMTFDSDAPASGRMAYYGVDDKAAGAAVMRELAKVLGEQGQVAVLAGNQAATNLQARVAGVREQAARYPGIRIVDVYYHPETAPDAAAKMQSVQNANPDIDGWALVGGWPLYTDNALDGINAKVVSLDPLPLPLEYLKSGQVQVLIGQPYYNWGYESIRYIVEKVHLGKIPESEMIYADFDIVTQDNAEDYSRNWEKWNRN